MSITAAIFVTLPRERQQLKARYRRTKVSKTFYDTLLNAYPAARKKESYRRLLGYLCFGASVDQETGELILSQEMAAQMEGKPLNQHYSRRRFVEAFSREVLPLEITEWSYSSTGPGRCSTVRFKLDQFVQEALVRELKRVWKDDQQIVLETGEPWTRTSAKENAVVDAQAALERLREAHCEDARLIMTYLADRPIEKYAIQVELYMDQAIAALSRQYVDKTDKFALTERAKALAQLDVCLRQLRQLELNPTAVVAPSKAGRTARLQPQGISWANIPKAAYNELITGWTQFDLRSAQLAIAAAQWGLEGVSEFLKQGKNIWTELYDSLGLTPEVKPILKKAVYATLYGASIKDTVVPLLDSELGVGVGTRFVAHPLIAEIIQKRDEQIRRIVKDGGARDCYGEWIKLEWVSYNTAGGKQAKRPNAASVLAQLGQAAELNIIAAVFRLAQTTDAFSIMVYKYDGVAVSFRDAQRKALWTARIKEAVQAVAKEIGVHTELETE